MDHQFSFELDEVGAHLIGSKCEGSESDESNHKDDMVGQRCRMAELGYYSIVHALIKHQTLTTRRGCFTVVPEEPHGHLLYGEHHNF
jgi:hypothetical protein